MLESRSNAQKPRTRA